MDIVQTHFLPAVSCSACCCEMFGTGASIDQRFDVLGGPNGAFKRQTLQNKQSLLCLDKTQPRIVRRAAHMMALKCGMCSWKVTAFRAVDIPTGCRHSKKVKKLLCRLKATCGRCRIYYHSFLKVSCLRRNCICLV